MNKIDEKIIELIRRDGYMDKKYFETVFIFFIDEPYAMGGGGHMAFMNEAGVYRYMDYRSAETPYEEIIKVFPAVQGCNWNGPIPGEDAGDEIVIFMNGDNKELQTRVNESWHHLYLGYGNHLVVRNDRWPEFNEKIAGFKKKVDIYGAWKEIAKNMCKGGY